MATEDSLKADEVFQGKRYKRRNAQYLIFVTGLNNRTNGDTVVEFCLDEYYGILNPEMEPANVYVGNKKEEFILEIEEFILLYEKILDA